MKKPIEPEQPKKPEEPKRTYFSSIPYSIDISELTLQDVLDKIAETGNRIDELSWAVRRALGHVQLKDAQFELERCYEYYSMNLEWNQPVEITLTDTGFAEAQIKYKARLEKYQAKLVKYESDMVKYTEDLKAYLAEQRAKSEKQRAKTEAQELKLLANLQKKYSK